MSDIGDIQDARERDAANQRTRLVRERRASGWRWFWVGVVLIVAGLVIRPLFFAGLIMPVVGIWKLIRANRP